MHDGEVLHVGPLALTAYFTPSHTSAGTLWTWDSCEGTRCLHMVNAYSLLAADAASYRFFQTIQPL
jgi:metallo-beta-lactamase class B